MLVRAQFRQRWHFEQRRYAHIRGDFADDQCKRDWGQFGYYDLEWDQHRILGGGQRKRDRHHGVDDDNRKRDGSYDELWYPGDFVH